MLGSNGDTRSKSGRSEQLVNVINQLPEALLAKLGFGNEALPRLCVYYFRRFKNPTYELNITPEFMSEAA